jgi:hypothetical protein
LPLSNRLAIYFITSVSSREFIPTCPKTQILTSAGFFYSLYFGKMSRLPRFQRVATVARIRLTERDHKIIRLTHRHRFLRSHQIIALIGGSAQNLSRRLQWLFHHGYLERPRAQLQYYERGGSKTIAYGLGNKSGSLLQLNPAAWGEKNRAIGRMYLAHALLVSDVMVSLELACRQRGIRLLHEDELNLPVETPLHWRVKLRDGILTRQFSRHPAALRRCPAVARRRLQRRCSVYIAF